MSRMNVSRLVLYQYDSLDHCLEKQLRKMNHESCAYLGLYSSIVAMQAYLHRHPKKVTSGSNMQSSETVICPTKQTQKWNSCRYSHYEDTQTRSYWHPASHIPIRCIWSLCEHFNRLLKTKMAMNYHPNPNPMANEHEATPETRITSEQTAVR